MYNNGTKAFYGQVFKNFNSFDRNLQTRHASQKKMINRGKREQAIQKWKIVLQKNCNKNASNNNTPIDTYPGSSEVLSHRTGQ
jgi:hypothetical protein